LIYQGIFRDFSRFSFVKQFPSPGKNAKKQRDCGGFAAWSEEFSPILPHFFVWLQRKRRIKRNAEK
jgi:hypothetical protein